MITLHILRYRLMTFITCKLFQLDSCLLLYNVNKSPYIRTLRNFHKINDLATNFDQKCYHYWPQWQPVMNKVACNTVLSQSKTSSRSVSTQHHLTATHSSGVCLYTASCNQLSPSVQVCVYTQLHVTNCHPHFRCVSTHSFM